MSKRVSILIDGSNFYYKLKDLGLNHLLYFNFKTFVNELVGANKLISACYYVGRIRQDGTKKTEKLFADQQKLIAALKKHGVRYSFGYLLKSNGSYHEKGVDVQMAVDLLVAAYDNFSDKILLVSSDTDLEPAIKKARAKNKTVEYIGFSHMPSRAMTRFCNKTRLFSKEEMASFIDS